MKWFVMLNVQDRALTPLVGEDEHENTYVKLFDTSHEAHQAAERNLVGHACGYEVYTWAGDIIKEPR